MKTLGPFELVPDGVRTVEKRPVGGTTHDNEARAEVWRVRHRDGWYVEIGFLTFVGGQQQIQGLDYSEDAPKPLHRVARALVMGVTIDTSGRQFLELSQAQLDAYEPPYRSQLKKATEEELDAGAGCSVSAELQQLGLRIGTREDVLGDTGNRKGYMCTLLPPGNEEAAVVAFVLTRVLPLYGEYVNHGRTA